jgi:prephenate dehydrogenase
MSTESCDLKIAVIGLGLMGGSLAYALRGFRNSFIAAYDADEEIRRLAGEKKAVDHYAPSLPEAVKDADLVIFCSSPSSILHNMEASLADFKPGALVSDVCGVKRDIAALAAEKFPDHVDYIGLHPMAGKEVGGFINADPLIFKNAGFIIVLPPRAYQEKHLRLLEELSLYIGAGRVAVNRTGEHDAIISYTSDLMHISAAMLCAGYHPGMTAAHTAGAFRDCTRIAQIDPDLWTDLFLRNAENILEQLDRYRGSLSVFREALAAGDSDALHSLLQKASRNKELIMTL